MRQCAEDACIALGFINPGDVATMMARMKKALKGLARDVVSHVAGRSITSRGRCSPSRPLSR